MQKFRAEKKMQQPVDISDILNTTLFEACMLASKGLAYDRLGFLKRKTKTKNLGTKQGTS